MGGILESIGTVRATLGQKGEQIESKLRVIEDTGTVTPEGLLGKDVLHIDEVHIKRANLEEGDQGRDRKHIGSLLRPEHNLRQTYGKGAEILNRLGYQKGYRLGRKLQGIPYPIEAAPTRSDRRYLGSEPDLERCLIRSIKVGNKHQTVDLRENDRGNMEVIPNPKPRRRKRTEPHEPATQITLSPRSEHVIEISVQSIGDHVCPSRQIAKGVYVANTIGRLTQGKAYVGMINTNSHEVTLKDYRPQLEPLERYSFRPHRRGEEREARLRETRYMQLMEILKLDPELQAVEKESVTKVCRKYMDIFHLPGDKLTYTNVQKFSLPFVEGAGIVNRKQYRIPQKHQGELTKQVKGLLENDIIEPSTSPYNSPVSSNPNAEEGAGFGRKPKI